MNIVIPKNPKFYFSPLFSPPNFLFHFPQLSRCNRKFLSFSRRKWLYNPKSPNFSTLRALSASESASYGGWDDLRLSGNSDNSGESDQLRNFLASIGIDDKKHIFMFLFGFVCALAISRVRVSSIFVFPASVLVFAIGFSLGFVRGGNISEVSVSGSKRKAKEEAFRVYTEKLRIFVDFLDGLGVKVSNLKNDVQTAIDNNKVTVNDLENYVKGMESMQLLASNARNDVEGSIDHLGNNGGLLVENQKPSRRKKEVGEVGFDLLQIIRHMLGETVGYAKPNKVKDNIKQENVVNDQGQANGLTPVDGETVLNSVYDNKRDLTRVFSPGSSNKSVLDHNIDRRVSEKGKIKFGETGGSPRRSTTHSEEYSCQNNRSWFINSQHVSLKIGHNDGAETWEANNNSLDSVDFRVSIKHGESESSFAQEQILKKSSGAYKSFQSERKSENETSRSQFSKRREIHKGDSHLADLLSGRETEVDTTPSSVVSDDMAFDRYLREANDLLKQAKECIRGDEERAEVILYKSARLLSKAMTMKPMSLLAVGLLGNTYLLHGELKLKISRELRTLLSGSIPISVDKRGRVLTKEKVAAVLIDVCEECEELFVEAGRQYRMALSIDGNDVRALYNWGLALSFRAQLIADIGPEAALDADKVFLAAIDKFDAMMSKGNVYASDALFRWGVALQQRSRLRPSDSKEKVKLLQQAKTLYEDALHMDSGNFQHYYIDEQKQKREHSERRKDQFESECSQSISTSLIPIAKTYPICSKLSQKMSAVSP